MFFFPTKNDIFRTMLCEQKLNFFVSNVIFLENY